MFADRFDQPQLMVDLAKQNGSRVRRDHLIGRLDFDGPIEFRLKESILSFTHRVILPCKGLLVAYPLNAEDYAMVPFILSELREYFGITGT